MYYKIFKHSIKIEDINTESYGIIVCENRKVIRTLFDVSTDYEALVLLVNSLNENKGAKHIEIKKIIKLNKLKKR